MMSLIERLEYDDDVVADQKAKVLEEDVADIKVKVLKMMLLIERSKC